MSLIKNLLDMFNDDRLWAVKGLVEKIVGCRGNRHILKIGRPSMGPTMRVNLVELLVLFIP